MAEFNSADAAGFVEQGRFGRRYFCVALFTLVGGESFFSVMAGPAGLSLIHLFHRDFVLPLGNRKQFGMAVVAFERGRMSIVHELDRSISRADDYRSLGASRRTAGRMLFVLRGSGLEALYAAMAAGALRIGRKRRFTVMAGAAILALIKRLHGEVLFFFYGQSLHLEKLCVALLTADLFFIRVDLVAERYRLNRLRINDITDLRSALRKRNSRHAKKKHCYHSQQNDAW